MSRAPKGRPGRKPKPKPRAERPPRRAPGHGPAFAEPAPARPRADTPPEGSSRRMVIYGVHPVEEALRGRRRVHRIWATEKGEWPKVTVVSPEELEERALTDAHQGVAALVDPYPYAEEAAFLAVANPLIVALDEVTDPQNLGAVARTAEAV